MYFSASDISHVKYWLNPAGVPAPMYVQHTSSTSLDF